MGRLEPEEKFKELERVAILALQKAHERHESLGASGEESVAKNQFGETALRIDLEAEEAVLSVLRKNNVPIKVISEEHGVVTIGNNPIYLGILDGLDGTNLYREQRGKGRYGTMFGIFANLDPLYDDYVFGGIMEHAQNRLYFAVKGKGSWVLFDNGKERIHCSSTDQLNQDSRLYADTAFDQQFKSDVLLSRIGKFQARGYNVVCLRSSAIHYADLACGNVDGVVEFTRKGNLEIAVAYPLIKEAGGVMIDGSGRALDRQRYNSFGQKEHIPVISASSPNLATDILAVFNGKIVLYPK